MQRARCCRPARPSWSAAGKAGEITPGPPLPHCRAGPAGASKHRHATDLGSPSQHAVLQPAGTASLAGASIGQAFRQRRSTSEGTVQEGEAAPRGQHQQHDCSQFRPPAPVTSKAAAASAAGGGHAQPTDAPAPLDSAVSKAPPPPPLPAVAEAPEASGAGVRPTDSISSAVAGAPQPSGGGAAAAAASLVSHHHHHHHERATADSPERLPRQPSAAAAASKPCSLLPRGPLDAGVSKPRAHSQGGGGGSVGGGARAKQPSSAAAQHKLHSVVSAALARGSWSGAVAAAASKADSESHSGNHMVIALSLKCKPPGRPPRAPGGTPAPQPSSAPPPLQPQASITSQGPPAPAAPGPGPGGDGPAQSVEDAVSMVDAGPCGDTDSMCDAVSQANGGGVVHVELQGGALLGVRLAATSAAGASPVPKSL